MIAIGDTFFFTDHHLFVVISNPLTIDNKSKVLLVPLCTYHGPNSGCDDSCVIDVGDHAFLNRKSFVDYRYPQAVGVEVLELARECTDNQVCQPRERLKGEIVRRVHRGAFKSKFLDSKWKLELERQGFKPA